MHMVMKNSDMTEGRGPMIMDKLFEALHDAENYIDMKPGIMGSCPKGGRIKQYKETGSYGDYDIREVNAEGATKQGPPMVSDPDWSGVIATAKSVVDEILNGSYHEDNDDKHYMYEEAMQAVYGKDFFDWMNANTE